MSVIQQLLTENPMVIEVKRLHRRFFGLERANTLNAVVLVLAGMAYLALLMIVWYYRADVDPIALIYLQTFLFLLVGPAMLHGSIAGEREKRSWDLLLVAPITKAQIVAGKFLGALSAMGGGALLFLLPIAIAAVSYNPSWTGAAETSTSMRLYDLALLEGVSLSFLVLVCATAILISARSKRSFMALGATIGVLMTFLVIIPVLIATGLGYDRMQTEFSLGLHPFFVLMKIHDATSPRSYDEVATIPNWFYGVPQIVTYLLFTIILLVWAERTLRFADGEATFIPRKHHA